MNQEIPLYSFVRSSASIYLVQVERMEVQPSAPGQQTLSLRLGIEETLWGEPGKPIRRAQVTQPESDIARLKFPDPIWGRVELREDAHLFLVTHELSDAVAKPLYVEEIVNSADPVLSAIREVLAFERVLFEQGREGQDAQARRARYLNYLVSGLTVRALFGGEALAKDEGLLEIDENEEVARTMAAVFSSDQTVFVRLSSGAWMWDDIYARTNTAGRIAIINATLEGLVDASEDIRRFSLDHLVKLNPADVQQAGVMESFEAARLLREQLTQETAIEVRDHLQKLIVALRR